MRPKLSFRSSGPVNTIQVVFCPVTSRHPSPGPTKTSETTCLTTMVRVSTPTAAERKEQPMDLLFSLLPIKVGFHQ